MAELTYREAVARGIAQEMARNDRVVLIGEDIAGAGGVRLFRWTPPPSSGRPHEQALYRRGKPAAPRVGRRDSIHRRGGVLGADDGT